MKALIVLKRDDLDQLQLLLQPLRLLLPIVLYLGILRLMVRHGGDPARQACQAISFFLASTVISWIMSSDAEHGMSGGKAFF